MQSVYAGYNSSPRLLKGEVVKIKDFDGLITLDTFNKNQQIIKGDMENQIEKFDPSKLMDGVKDRIKATFVSLIPDDAWNSMVEKELYVFFLKLLCAKRKNGL